MAGAKRKPSRLRVARRRRAARKTEATIAEYAFPLHIRKRVQRRHPSLDDEGWALVEQGLREWFVCCAWRGRTVLAMPSKLVDDAWHEFILDSVAYTQFCDAAFGSYLHHMPDEAMGELAARGQSVPVSPDGLAETVRAWDRSGMGREGDSVLWDLDARLGVGEPLGVTPRQVEAARTRAPYPLAGGWACGGVLLGYTGAGPADGAAAAGTGGDGGFGGGGGCSGGCGGG